MTIVSFLASTVLGLLVAWVCGSFILRVGGLVLIVFSLLTMATGSPPSTPMMIGGVGVAAWISGHWLWALKHKSWKSRLVGAVFRYPVLRVLSPLRAARTQPDKGEWVTPERSLRYPPLPDTRP